MAMIRTGKVAQPDINPKDYSAVIIRMGSIERTMAVFQYLRWLVSICIFVARIYNLVKRIIKMLPIQITTLGYGRAI